MKATPTLQTAARPTVTPTPRIERTINPLTGMNVEDPSLLRMPAVLLSISHFPATARPQAGLSFAAFVYEFYITEGATRFLAVLHGEWPAPEVPAHGGCEPRVGPEQHVAVLLGNRVWLDTNANGVQDPGERGIVGVCVNLYDESGALIGRTASDTNGFYGFDLPRGRFVLEFELPDGMAFSPPDVGDDSLDSNVDPTSGRLSIDLSSDDRSVDAGLIPPRKGAQALGPAAATPLAEVGPIRSGRLIYRHIASTYEDSCLIFAYASPEVLERLPKCLYVLHTLADGGYMLSLDELWTVAKENERRSKVELDYSGYSFSSTPPSGGAPATTLQVYFAYQNQSGWYYDAASESYLRYVDTSERELAGILHADTDRLTGRQLYFANVVVLFADHEVVSPTNLDIHLDPGRSGKAMLFRDGLAYDMTWSTPKDAQGNGNRPIRFLTASGEPEPLKPGHTWVIVVTPETTVQEVSPGYWQLVFVPPVGAK